MLPDALPALVAAQFALLARGAQHRRIAGCLARGDLAGGVAEVGAVEVEADAAGEYLGTLLAEAGVGTGGTSLGAIDAG